MFSLWKVLHRRVKAVNPQNGISDRELKQIYFKINKLNIRELALNVLIDKYSRGEISKEELKPYLGKYLKCVGQLHRELNKQPAERDRKE